MDARCPECEKVAVLDDEITKVKCPHCSFEADYETYLNITNHHLRIAKFCKVSSIINYGITLNEEHLYYNNAICER